VSFAWRLKSNARRYCRGRNYVLITADVRDLQSFGDTSKVGLLAFLELWLKMTSLELCLRMADEHEELLSCGSGWRVLPV